MPLSPEAPAWAAEHRPRLREQRRQGQFILYGNVHDRIAGQRRAGQSGQLCRERAARRLPGRVHLRPRQRPAASSAAADLLAELGGAGRARRRRSRQPLPADRAGQRLSALPRATCARCGARHNADARRVHPARRRRDHCRRRAAAIELGSLASLLRDWAGEAPFCNLPFASHPDRRQSQRPRSVGRAQPAHGAHRVPLPPTAAAERGAHATAARRAGGLRARIRTTPEWLADPDRRAPSRPSRRWCKTRLISASRSRRPTWSRSRSSWSSARRAGLVDFIESRRTLADYHGQQALKTWLRQDVALWNAGDLKALPMGYLLCGPGRHRQDLPGRVPGRRSRRACRQAQELPRPLGRLERGQPGEDLPPRARARPLHGLHRRGRPDARPTARFGQRQRASPGASMR